jgi:hypothetical protein
LATLLKSNPSQSVSVLFFLAAAAGWLPLTAVFFLTAAGWSSLAAGFFFLADDSVLFEAALLLPPAILLAAVHQIYLLSRREVRLIAAPASKINVLIPIGNDSMPIYQLHLIITLYTTFIYLKSPGPLSPFLAQRAKPPWGAEPEIRTRACHTDRYAEIILGIQASILEIPEFRIRIGYGFN